MHEHPAARGGLADRVGDAPVARPLGLGGRGHPPLAAEQPREPRLGPRDQAEALNLARHLGVSGRVLDEYVPELGDRDLWVLLGRA